MTLLCLLCWGPIPLACLWVGSQVDYLSGSVSLGILAAFVAPSADPVTQTLVAVPLILLYEIGILLSYLAVRRQKG